MGLRDKFAQSFARSKTMSGPEKKANEIMGKLLLKKAILPIVLMFVIIIAGAMLKINSWVTLGINLVIAVGAFFYIRNSSKSIRTLNLMLAIWLV